MKEKEEEKEEEEEAEESAIQTENPNQRFGKNMQKHSKSSKSMRLLVKNCLFILSHAFSYLPYFLQL